MCVDRRPNNTGFFQNVGHESLKKIKKLTIEANYLAKCTNISFLSQRKSHISYLCFFIKGKKLQDVD